MSPNQPPTIWVPLNYVESGPPRGNELVRQGYEKVTERGNEQAPQGGAPPVAAPGQSMQPAAPAGARQQQPSWPAPAQAPSVQSLKSRISLLEVGDNGLLLPFSEKMRTMAVGVILDPSQSSGLTKYATITNQAERAAFAVRLQQEYGTTVTVYIGAPDGLAPGKVVKADIYDGMGSGLLSTVSAAIPQVASADAAARESAVSKALTDVTAKIKEAVMLSPWYGKVAAVEGDRAYINAGKEAGLRIGQLLKVYHGGKVIPGLGFAPGDRVGTIEVGGFVGPNGAFGTIKDGKGIQSADLVSAE